MAKILENTTGSDITVVSSGASVPAGGTYDIQEAEYLIWATDEVVTEITADINAGNLVLNDGNNNLSAADALFFLRYPDSAFNIRFLSDPERVNGFVSKDVQRAIEEAKTGSVPVSPTTTVDATPTVAYSVTLADDSTYEFDGRVIARGTAIDLDADFQQVVTVRRRSGGSAEIIGNIMQKRSNRSSSGAGTEICWVVTGNEVRLEVTGLAATSVKWQPQIEFEIVS
jgi:hypothetical protein